jgi:hypothetical protein
MADLPLGPAHLSFGIPPVGERIAFALASIELAAVTTVATTEETAA